MDKSQKKLTTLVTLALLKWVIWLIKNDQISDFEKIIDKLEKFTALLNEFKAYIEKKESS